MTTEQLSGIDTHAQDALTELQELIRLHFPTATFAVSRGEDDAESIHLTTTVDVEDPDDVMDVVIDRVLALQVEEGIPVHVIPIRTPERALQAMQLQQRQRPRADIERVAARSSLQS